MNETLFLKLLDSNNGSILNACIDFGASEKRIRGYIKRNKVFCMRVRAIQGKHADETMIANKMSIEKVRAAVCRVPKSRKQIAKECGINAEDAATCLLKLRINREIINRDGKYMVVE